MSIIPCEQFVTRGFVMAKIFISYSRVDLQFVRDLYDVLQHMRPNDDIWYDKAPHGLLGGVSMFEFYGFLIRVVRAEVGLTVMLYEDANDTDPLTFHTQSRDPYCAAGLLKLELDLYTESGIIQLGEMIYAHID